MKVLENWSQTKSSTVEACHEPENVEEIKDILRRHPGEKVRMVGANMSPNGIAPGSHLAISMMKLNQIKGVDQTLKLVTVEPAVRIEDLLEHLAQSELTLHNLPSTDGMTMAGLVQASCHGTGLHLCPLEEAVERLTIIKPDGTEVVLDQSHREFHAAKCALGTFGPIVELTLRCVPAYFLQEVLEVMTWEQAKVGHVERIEKVKHVKYHHLPYTGHVVVYTHHEITPKEYEALKDRVETSFTPMEQKEALLRMYHQEFHEPLGRSNYDEFLAANWELSFAEIREALLEKDPLDPNYIKAINLAELDYWKRSQHSIVDRSNKRLIFECGGRQHVREFAFPIQYPMQELDFVQEIMELIESAQIPAPVPIEQRWSAGSRSLLSPVYTAQTDPRSAPFSWVGIIMYLTKNEKVNKEITAAFEDYYGRIVQNLGAKYNLDEHLAKVGVIGGQNEAFMKHRSQRLQSRLEQFHVHRREFDPENVFLSPELEDILF